MLTKTENKAQIYRINHQRESIPTCCDAEEHTSCIIAKKKDSIWQVLRFTSVRPTILISGWVKHAAGMLKWFNTLSLPQSFSTTTFQEKCKGIRMSKYANDSITWFKESRKQLITQVTRYPLCTSSMSEHHFPICITNAVYIRNLTSSINTSSQYGKQINL